ncbi:CerR family C-terminal domain-containing protein [Pseudodesulfovibrio thermohalotolerans]|uniref:CerR family C-terminal domain-containing protein n=1 Tax=Pseudodesulfovibrio thermohalotolerans TaxID=2880651 RepID=UPI0022B9DCB5|nr:CerR family C-terminal domain-containing protein [Pseudodesulfovibrio thermohalotolerans]WFS63306.1 CerR family C-terminal domain-containing protein [Pseudodesulfovibrio thermohalotolerans]
MSSREGKSLKQTQGEETRATLIYTGARLFAQNGYNGVSMRTLAAEAGVNLATVSYHFGGKAGLYEAIIREIFKVRDQIYPPTPTVEARLAEAGDSPEEKAAVADWFMDTLINGLLTRTEYAWGTVIISRELVHPSELYPKMEELFFRPNLESLCTLVRGTAAHCLSKADMAITAHAVISIVIKLLEGHDLLCRVIGWDSFENHLETVSQIIKTRIRGLLGLPMENAQ